jgi:hypothetical protein
MTQKTEKLAALWQVICETGRAIKAQLRMGMMVRWSGEERDGVDFDLNDLGERELVLDGRRCWRRRHSMPNWRSAT